ncbi:unnamed protein product [Caenorhabditis angaria]|uniref:Uncharacterized protein n=1 Tax=Caenorhabditis angaria TaxID=860376 RepID=A0A9P1ILD4_9PELO|nr:unnamed protein product [Caenorhabditis angaria]
MECPVLPEGFPKDIHRQTPFPQHILYIIIGTCVALVLMAAGMSFRIYQVKQLIYEEMNKRRLQDEENSDF